MSRHALNVWTVALGGLLAALPAQAAGDDELMLHHADFHARLGMKVYVEVGKAGVGQTLRAALTSDKGTSGSVGMKVNAKEEEVLTFSLRNLPAAKYTLTVELVGGGRTLKQAVRTFEKPYDGLPRVGLDENNAICVDGKPFFPVTTWGVGEREKDFEDWGLYANTFMGYTFSKESATVDGWKRFLDAAQRHGKKVIGPDYGNYWPNGDCRRYYTKDGKRTKDRQAKLEVMEQYVRETRDHPALLMWAWLDEPELDNNDTCVPAAEVRKWTDMCHRLDAQHLVYVNTGGGGFARPQDNWLHKHVKRYTYLYNEIGAQPRVTLADVLGEDIYPKFGPALEKALAARQADQAAGKPVTELPSAENMVTALDTVRQYNRDLAPVFANVRTAGFQDGTPPPTPAQLRFLFWANVVHGAKGIAWFHYFGETPAENKKEMARCLEQVTGLAPVICGPDYAGTVIKKEAGGGRVDLLAKQGQDALYLFAANIKESPEKVTFTPDFAPAKIEVLHESREVKADGRTFTDSFEPLAVHVYRLTR